MKQYHESGNVSEAAGAAGVDWKTASKYVRGAPGPEESRPERHWRTHVDAFGEVWPEIERWLQQDGALSAKAAFEELCRRYPGGFQAGQLRSLQRRFAVWKQAHGPEPEVVFRQEHLPGQRWQLDWCDGTELEVTVRGESLAHKLAHVVLPYSNWEWATVCRSESFASLRSSFQAAAWELGAVAWRCQTDQSSTATHPRGKGQRGRDWNERYLALLGHYGVRPEKIALASPEQNGDVESSHRHLRRALADGLALRGSRDFGSWEQYQNFVAGVLRHRNASRAERLAQERTGLLPLPAVRLPEWDEMEARVSRESLVRVGRHGYSVPARYIGRKLRARVFEQRVEFWDGNTQVYCAPVLSQSSQGVLVDWRHVLPQLVRKPGALARWRHRGCLFPDARWRSCYDQLRARYSEGRAEREYLGLLMLALEHGVSAVTPLLNEDITLDGARARFQAATPFPAMELRADLTAYDQLLEVCHG